MYKPSATYRIQFHKDFTFSHLEAIIPYLHELGISTIYASPIFKAIAGSTHGYDVTCPHQVNPEIGTEAELISLTKKLKAHGIGWVQDIVPNHMSFVPANTWLMDVLKFGKGSKYHNFFDINFVANLTDERLMVPFLGETLEEALAEDKLKVSCQQEELFIDYQAQLWPINTDGANFINKVLGVVPDVLPTDAQFADFNANPPWISELLELQYYRLCQHSETATQINYRRFFTVNSLICINMDDENVFDVYHRYINELVKKGVFQGLRIDHIDGLADPETYLLRLRKLVGEDIFIVVEKILAEEEVFPTNWPVQGTTGYEFLSLANNLLSVQQAENDFDQFYESHLGKKIDIAQLGYDKKHEILYGHMLGELEHLTALFVKLQLATEAQLNLLKEGELQEVIGEMLILCPVYRFYINNNSINDDFYQQLKLVLEEVSLKSKSQDGASLLLNALALLKTKTPQSAKAVVFFQRCMQFSGPLMAKGIEDTLMYTYNRFTAHNEVGDAPEAFGISVADFNRKMIGRQENLPLSLNASATHDTKKGEDSRARLNVLSDFPEAWQDLVKQLMQELPATAENEYAIHPNDALLLFQTIVGVISLNDEDDDLNERLSAFVEKALRESKKRSNWDHPNEDYEKQAKEITLTLINRNGNSHQLLQKFIQKIEPFAVVNSLVQQLLKFTCPGIPDIYQGTELWDFSLVDPDNRRPVDYEKRQQLIAEIADEVEIKDLWTDRNSGKIKLWLVQHLLRLRNQHKDLFEMGEYIPLETKGFYSDHLIAFARRHKNQWVIVAAGLGMGKCCNGDTEKLMHFNWKDTSIILPAEMALCWQNTVGEQPVKYANPQQLQVGSLFSELPIAILTPGFGNHDRGSGILMPLFALPSETGIGEMGASAFDFVKMLNHGRQKFWQLLPLNPVSSSQSYSPYSATSAMAGNTLLIDFEWLRDKGFLTQVHLDEHATSTTNQVDYALAAKVKKELLHIAYQQYLANPINLIEPYQLFCKDNISWLSDFACYQSLKKKFDDLPWNQWEEKFKMRHPAALAQYIEDHAHEIEEIKWQQFIFETQWLNLRKYANELGIRLIGDLPFYVGFDSADVWANPKLFKLDENLEMKVVAGVPPDMLSEDGQKWGMPIFNWGENDPELYNWWKLRIAKNMELYDLLRIDHFRAIHSYWEIPAEDKDAKAGKWIEGPGAVFLDMLCKEFGQSNFLVEDLGGDMDGPKKLRDDFELAGMKILQFAFGDDMPYSEHQVHQFKLANTVVYNGTHDNNTIKGWYEHDLDNAAKAQLSDYLGVAVNQENVSWLMIRLALSSTANISILQMQDILGLDGSARMNIPGTAEGNWLWRMENWPEEKLLHRLAQMSWLFGRI